MSIENKYRVHEVAKDFGKSTKEITDVLTEYSKTPKNHMQVLEPQELNIVFDYMTKKYPVNNMEEVLAKQSAERKAPTTQVIRKPAEDKKSEKSEKKSAPAKPAASTDDKQAQKAKQQAQKKKRQPAKPHEIGRAHV